MKQSVYALLVGSAAAQPKYIYQGKDSLILDQLVPQPKLIAATFDTVCASTDLKTANTNLAAAIVVLDTKKGDTVGNLAALKKIVATKLTDKNTAVDLVTAADKTDRLTLLEADNGNLKVLNLLKAKYLAEHNYSENLELNNDNTLTRVVLDSGTNLGKDPITAATAAVFKGTLFKANETAQAALTAATTVRGALATETTNTTRYGSQNLNQTHLGKIDPAQATSVTSNNKNNNVAQYSTKTTAFASLASTTNVDFSETVLYAGTDSALQSAWTAYDTVFTTRCELTDLNAAGAASVTIATDYGGTGTAVASIKVTPATAVITLASAKKIIDVASMPSCCVQDSADATKCAVASTPYLGVLNPWEINQTTVGAADSIGYGTGLKGATDSANLLTIDPTFLTDTAEATFRKSMYNTQPGGSLTRAKDTAMEAYYIQKRISDRFWLKRIKVTLTAMGATFATTLVGNIVTYKPMINDAATTFTMGATTAAVQPNTVPVGNDKCTDAGSCKTAMALFTKLGLLTYKLNVVGTPANMFENNIWTYNVGPGAQATKKLMDVLIYTKTTTGGVTAFTATATTGETTIYADAWAYAKTFNALTGTTNDWRTLGKATFAKWKLYTVEITWASGSKGNNFTTGAGLGANTNTLKKSTSNDLHISVACSSNAGNCVSEDKCLEYCAKLPTAKYTVGTDGTLSNPVVGSLDTTLTDADNTGKSAGSEEYCLGVAFGSDNKCHIFSKGIAVLDAGGTAITNGLKPWAKVTTNAVQFITKLKLSAKGATSDKWTPWYTAGMAAYITKYKAFEEKNFLWQLDEQSYAEDLATYIKATGSGGLYERKTNTAFLAYHGAFNNGNGFGTRSGPTIKLTENTSSVTCKGSLGKADYPNGASTCLDTAGAGGGVTTFSDLAQNIYIPAVAVTFPSNAGNGAKTVTPMISLLESGNQGGTSYVPWKREQDALSYKRALWLDGMAAPGTYAMPSYGGLVPATGGTSYVKKYALTNGYVNYLAAKAEYDAQSDMVLQLKDDVAAAVAAVTAATNLASASVAGGSAKALNDSTTLRTTATTGLKAVMDAKIKEYKDFYMATATNVYGVAGAGTAYKATQDAGAGGKTAAQLAVTINQLRTAATGKWSDLKTAEKAVTDFMETCFTAAGVAKGASCVVGGYAAAVADVAAKTAIVKAEETKCKNKQWDAYKATLVSSMATRKSSMTTIATLIDDEDVKRAAVKPGATGSRCEKPTSNGDPKSRGTKPCTTDTDCCGAATGKLADTGATALVSADSNMATMTIEVCQPKTDTKYKYRPPRMPMATAFPATVEWDFKCIGDARRIAAMATFAAASLFMMQ